jgi:hypothetical protein
MVTMDAPAARMVGAEGIVRGIEGIVPVFCGVPSVR